MGHGLTRIEHELKEEFSNQGEAWSSRQRDRSYKKAEMSKNMGLRCVAIEESG